MEKEEIKVLSECCKSKVEYEGGGYNGENFVPTYDVCSKCGRECGIIKIIPKGYKEPEFPF
ncbi:unnamed protein product [marine sediment metagenome]|uniref:Uncharacterized protein n=1 Tax=marine sediment metagenome TaxID=412755 RepID=X0X4V8_9ZZZZ